MGWKPIDTAPKDGSLIVCWSPRWEAESRWGYPCFLRWKTNDRIASARKHDPESVNHQSDSYFGDPVEWDDYELAEEGNGPTHWHPLDPVPK